MEALKKYFEPRAMVRNVRFYVIAFSIGLSELVYVLVKVTIPPGTLVSSRLIQIYALLALGYLYLALMISPLMQAFPQLFGEQIKKSRRAIGVAAFYFAVIHGCIAFFGELGGFRGVGFLDNRYLLATGIGLLALLVLYLLAVTSFDAMIERMGFKRWKQLQRLAYAAGILILLHAMLLGSDFADLSRVIPRVIFGAAALLLILESWRLGQYIKEKSPRWAGWSPVLAVVFGAAVLSLGYLLGTSGSGGASLNVHAQHIALAQQAQQKAGGVAGNGTIPSLTGDPNARFSVGLEHPAVINPGDQVPLRFVVYDANTGSPPKGFQILYTKPAHLVIVNSSLNYYSHIHPQPDGNGFNITTSFPAPGRYHLYINFQPIGAIEQQYAASVDVGQFSSPDSATQTPESNPTDTQSGYQVSLDAGNLSAAKLTVGQQTVNIHVTGPDGQPAGNLKPYLDAFGHMVMVKEDSYDYLHIHPNNLTPPGPNDSGGPDVKFLPIGLYGPIKPGVYRIFLQLNPDNQLLTFNFTVRVNP